MKLKRAISLLLLALYLTGMGGPAFVSLSCECVARMKARAAHGVLCGGGCCHDAREHDGDHPAARADWKAPCCANHHSTEIELYTASDDGEKSGRGLRSMPLALPGARLAEVPAPVAGPVLCPTAERAAPFSEAPWFASAGLRAPPVSA